jgi:hypothetical protein
MRALHVAAEKGHLAVVEVLLKAGANVDEVDDVKLMTTCSIHLSNTKSPLTLEKMDSFALCSQEWSLCSNNVTLEIQSRRA